MKYSQTYYQIIFEYSYSIIIVYNYLTVSRHAVFIYCQSINYEQLLFHLMEKGIKYAH